VSATVGLVPGVAGAVNAVICVCFDCLFAPGKPKRLAVGASLRKLAMLCFGVLKNRAPFDTVLACQAAR
jgi:transposase